MVALEDTEYHCEQVNSMLAVVGRTCDGCYEPKGVLRRQ